MSAAATERRRAGAELGRAASSASRAQDRAEGLAYAAWWRANRGGQNHDARYRAYVAAQRAAARIAL